VDGAAAGPIAVAGVADPDHAADLHATPRRPVLDAGERTAGLPGAADKSPHLIGRPRRRDRRTANRERGGELVAVKLGVKLIHVEAGLRSGDRTMPEEINRLVTDRISDLLLAPSPDAVENLKAEGEPASKIHLVGNIMIDSLLRHLPSATLDRIKGVPVKAGHYAVLTLHRPSNVDTEDTFRRILDAVGTIANEMPVVFPVHPRTRQRLKEFGLDVSPGLLLTDPLGYIDFLSLTSHARIILTDSGGLQEESTALGIQCLTLRENTERPITVTEGTNQVVGTDTAVILAGFRRALAAEGTPRKPDLWDGATAGRITRILCDFLAR